MVPIASGSDAGGSIRIPSSWTGLIGLKPTGHVVKFPLVKTIEDAKAYFEKTELSKPKTLVEPPKDLKKLKIAYTLKTPLKDLELSEVAKKAILETVAFLRKEGFTVEEVKEFPIDGYEGIKTYTVGGIGEESYVAAVKGVTEENKRQLDPTTYGLGTSSYMGPNANTDISSVKPLSTFIDQMNAFYKKYDLFLVPTNAVTAPSNDKKVDPYIEPDIAEQLYNINKIKDPKERFNLLTKQWLPMTRRSPYTWVFNLSGNPAISLPTYLSDKNLPFGVMFAAKDNSEKVLLEIGQYFQDKHQFKMNPAIRSSNVSENGKLPNLEINNITLKSKDNNISVDINSKNAENLTLSTKDITKETDLEKLKDKVIADNNNNINHKDQITSIRIVDLELQKDNKTVKLNAPRTVKIALLQNEQNKDILVYHIKQDNSIEFVPSVVTKDSLQFTIDHFSKFAIVAKVNTAFSSNEKAIHSSSVKEEKKVVNTNSTKLDSTPKTLPNTGESTNNFLSAIGLSFLALIGLLKRKNNN